MLLWAIFKTTDMCTSISLLSIGFRAKGPYLWWKILRANMYGSSLDPAYKSWTLPSSYSPVFLTLLSPFTVYFPRFWNSSPDFSVFLPYRQCVCPSTLPFPYWLCILCFRAIALPQGSISRTLWLDQMLMWNAFTVPVTLVLCTHLNHSLWMVPLIFAY